MNPRPSTLETAQEHALEWVRSLIISRELRPGQRVNQEDIAEQAGLSVAPVREALRTLEQEGQVTYLPRRGYFVTELVWSDLLEIYELRALLEARAVRAALPNYDSELLALIARAAQECAAAVDSGDVGAELAANRRFHFALWQGSGMPHTERLIRQLWDSTEGYRALYYNSAHERQATLGAHDRILTAAAVGDAKVLIKELDQHRQRALDVLGTILERG